MSQPNLNFPTKATGPVECLGQTFAGEEARREHFLELLAQNLHAFTFLIRQPTLPYANYLS